MLKEWDGGRVVQRPRRGTPESAGWDLYFPSNTVVKAGCKVKVDLMVQVFLPEDTYGQLSLRSSAAFNHELILLGGVIGKM
jgi:dUTPase